jgi:hypothetical protein
MRHAWLTATSPFRRFAPKGVSMAAKPCERSQPRRAIQEL